MKTNNDVGSGPSGIGGGIGGGRGGGGIGGGRGGKNKYDKNKSNSNYFEPK